ncbi:hypothetical protein J2X72_004506 [Phyllobacterium sp. 1468]|nr:hypothetical protein [Phyllobacterium sp. 1468]
MPAQPCRSSQNSPFLSSITVTVPLIGEVNDDTGALTTALTELDVKTGGKTDDVNTMAGTPRTPKEAIFTEVGLPLAESLCDREIIAFNSVKENPGLCFLPFLPRLLLLPLD